MFPDASEAAKAQPESVSEVESARATGSADLTPGAVSKVKIPTHSMVMLGGYEEKNAKGEIKHYFMLLNWWKGMPLVLVSARYLQACGCQVLFLLDGLTQDTDFARKEGLCAESCYPDNGEDGAAVLCTDYEYSEWED